MHDHEQHNNSPEQHEQLAPRIYAACLAAYNHGRLHGQWLDAEQAPDDLQLAITEMLERSPVPHAEDWAIHDYEGFGPFQPHEYERLETIARVAGGLAVHGPAFGHWVHEVGSDAEDAVQTFGEAYRGQWNSMADFAEQLLDDMGVKFDELVPQWLSAYVRVDLEALGRDLSTDYITAEGDNGVHVFDPNA